MKREIAKGAAWMLLFRFAERALGLVSTFILARLLVPADFGIVAMAMSVIAIIELASAFSFEIALIQKRELTRAHYDTAWTLNLIFAVACAIATALLAYPATLFYAEPRLAPVMYALAASWVLLGAQNIGVVDFRRNMDFSREFALLVSKKLVAFVITLSLAVTLRSYWALVAGTIAGRAAGLLLSYGMQSYRPRFSMAASRELFSFSGWMLFYNIADVALNKIPQFLIGRIHGPQALGFYTVGAEIAHLPSTDLIAPINRAVFPGYARSAVEPQALKQAFLGVIGVILLFAPPASIGVAVIAEPLVRVLLGEQWMEAVPVIQVLAISGGIFAINSNNVSAYFALGRSKLASLILLFRLALLIPLLAVLSHRMGILGVAYAELGASIAALAISYPALFRTLKLSWRDYLAAVWRPILAALLMGAAVDMLLARIPASATTLGAMWQIGAGVAFGVSVYALTLMALWAAVGKPRGAETYLLTRVSEMTMRLKKALTSLGGRA